MAGTAGNDTLTGGSGADSLDALAGDDLVFAGAGNDSILGGSGNDTIRADYGPVNQITTGRFDTSQGWSTSGTGYTSGGRYIADVDYSSSTLTYGTTLSGLSLGPGSHGAGQVVFDLAWNDGNPAPSSGYATFEMQINGVVYARVTTPDGDGSQATVTYLNGATGTVATIAEGSALGATGYQTLTVNLPNGVPDSGTLRFVVNAATGMDDFSLDNVQVITCAETGSGNDTVLAGLGDDIVLGDGGADSLSGEDGHDTLDGGAGNDTLIGGSGTDYLAGQAGDDLIDGGTGDDSVHAGIGNDSVLGGDDNDWLSGNEGNDTLLGEAGNDRLFGDGDDDLLQGGIGDDTLEGGDGNDLVQGGDGNDSLDGNDGNDTLQGGAGRDIIESGLGDDLVDGGDDADFLHGREGNDTLIGGEGADTLTGGTGADLFLVEGADRITDFDALTNSANGDEADNDVVDLSGFYNQASLDAWNAANPGQTYPNPLAWLKADQADGVLDQAGGLELYSPDGTPVTPADLSGENTRVLCFARGTRILTRSGARPIEALRAGDLVVTVDHGAQPVRWIGCFRLDPAQLAAAPKLRPVRIAAGMLGRGLPLRDLVVSPQHRILVQSPIARRLAGTEEVLVAAHLLAGLPGIGLDTRGQSVEYWHLLLDRHEVIFAEGAPSESLHLGSEAEKTFNAETRAEILRLLPALPAPARPFLPGRLGRQLAARHAKNGKPLLCPRPVAARLRS